MLFNKSSFGDDAQFFLFDTLVAPLRWEILSAGIKLKIFDYLQDARTAKDVALHLDFLESRAELFLNSMVSIGLIDKFKGKYQISSSYRSLLTSGSDSSLCGLLQHLSQIKHVSESEIIDLLSSKHQKKNGPTMKDPEFWNDMIEGLRLFHLSVRNPIVLDVLMSQPNWSDVNHILDLGAGSEQLAIDLLSVKPDLKVTIFDLPGIASLIKKQVFQKAQINVLEGDMNTASLGSGYDLVFASMVLYYADDLTHTLEKIRQSLNPGGMFLSFHEKLNSERTSPEFHIVGRIHAELKLGPLSLSAGSVEKALAEACFKDIFTQVLKTPFGDIELVSGIA
ncbi:class I SAM-dependent methyltransferase [Microbulbifer sp. JMSA002]|uniref:class I SAM-dependent methyltransferase n=1 Tax=Microbulbifer sp. JMSA002 TaxID=3243368 RepID=UPI0040394B26